jgi:hypothetical protein
MLSITVSAVSCDPAGSEAPEVRAGVCHNPDRGYLSVDLFRRRQAVGRGSSIGGVILVIWLIIGIIAAGQRGYFNSDDANCAKAGTIVVTIIAGPLNYLGVNPKINCDLPQPSK